MNLVVRRRRFLSARMECLRATVLGCEAGTTRDSFDARSSHVVAYAHGAPVGMVRETPSSPSVLSRWTGERWSLPTGSSVVELTRGVVAEGFRGHGIYRLLMLEVMAALPPESVTIATAAIEPDFVGRRFLEGLGFRPWGDAQRFCDQPRETYAIPIFTPVDAERQQRWRSLLVAFKERLTAGGVTVSDAADLRTAPWRSTGRQHAANVLVRV